MNCECCGKQTACAKDYREEADNLIKYFVCLMCLHLTDEDFNKKRRKKILCPDIETTNTNKPSFGTVTIKAS
jgi:hypothetical protein